MQRSHCLAKRIMCLSLFLWIHCIYLRLFFLLFGSKCLWVCEYAPELDLRKSELLSIYDSAKQKCCVYLKAFFVSSSTEQYGLACLKMLERAAVKQKPSVISYLCFFSRIFFLSAFAAVVCYCVFVYIFCSSICNWIDLCVCVYEFSSLFFFIFFN